MSANATAPPTSPTPPTNATAPTGTSPTANGTASPPPPSNSTTSSDAPAWSPPPAATKSRTPPVGNLPTNTNVGIIVGVAIGGFSVLVAVTIIYFFYRRRQKRLAKANESGQPPKDDPLKGPSQNLQQNYTPPSADKIEMFPLPTHSRAPSSTDNYGSEKPSSAFGFSESTFSYEELAMATNGFSIENLLGQGGFGYVHKEILPNGKVVAIKQLKAGSGQGERELQTEVEVINHVHHRHLASLVGYYISGVQRLLVYEFVSNNTLEYHLHRKGRPTMTWPTRMKIAIGSAKGLAYLHEDYKFSLNAFVF